MTFKQILKIAEIEAYNVNPSYNKKMLVTTKRGLSQYKRQYKKYKDSIKSLIDSDNFDFSELHIFERSCKIIEDIFDNAIIYK